MASPGCRRWQHKGRTSTNPALNRYRRSRSALYRADMAIGNPAQCSFHALRVQRPLWVTSRRKAAPISMSAFGGKADVNHSPAEGPLLAISGHLAASRNSLSPPSRYASRMPRSTYPKVCVSGRSGSVTQQSRNQPFGSCLVKAHRTWRSPVSP